MQASDLRCSVVVLPGLQGQGQEVGSEVLGDSRDCHASEWEEQRASDLEARGLGGWGHAPSPLGLGVPDTIMLSAVV